MTQPEEGGGETGRARGFLEEAAPEPGTGASVMALWAAALVFPVWWGAPVNNRALRVWDTCRAAPTGWARAGSEWAFPGIRR